MIKIINRIFKFYKDDFYKIPYDNRDEFINQKYDANLYREKIICIILFIINIGLIYMDLFKFKNTWDKIPAYKNLFYSHITLMVFLILFWIFFRTKGEALKNNIKTKKIIHLAIAIFLLNWSSVISINAQFIHDQISAYIITALCVASLAILNNTERRIIFISSYIIFVLGIFLFVDNPEKLSGNIINSLFIIILSSFVSKINYSYYVNDFINKKIIKEKNIELDNSYRNLEKIVDARTEDLKKANERIIEEISTRHKMEIEVVKTKLLYEEKVALLNKIKNYEKLRNYFFANISHELRTPLNLIFSAQQMVDLTLKGDKIEENKEKLFRNSKIIKQNSYRLIRIINNLIDITKMDTGYFKVNLQNIDIVKTVEDITLSVVEFIESKNITLVFDTEIEEKIVACDPDKIERIILNLLSNSIKFTQENGIIIVKVYENNGKVIISVKDNGIGIPKELQEIVFEKFVQVDKSISRNKEGSGIGLSLVKSLIEMQNGSIRLVSEDGNGSEFIIELPDMVVMETSENNKNLANEQIGERINIEFSDIYFD